MRVCSVAAKSTALRLGFVGILLGTGVYDANAILTCQNSATLASNSITATPEPPMLQEVYTATEDQILTAESTGANQQFGRGIALQGNELVISQGRVTEDEIGSVGIYRYESGSWILTTSFVSPDPYPGDEFFEVALDGDTLLVGAKNYGGCAEGCGNAFVFERNQGGSQNWGLVRQLVGSGKPQDNFGLNVALDGDIALVGARGNGEINWPESAVYVFARDMGGDNRWGMVKRLESDNAPKLDDERFGWELEIVGDSVFIIGDGQRTFYIYGRNEGGMDNWGLVQKLKPPCAVDNFTIDGHTLVANVFDPGLPASERNSALVFYRRDEVGMWTQYFELEEDFRLYDIALEANLLAAHAYDQSVVAYVYRRGSDATSWEQISRLTSSEPHSLRYGEVALDSGRAVVSYPYVEFGGYEGLVYAFRLSESVSFGHSGAWANLSTLGQGQLVDVDAENEFIFLSWFTYTDAVSENPREQRWLTAQGNYIGNKAVLPLYETLGGQFDVPKPVSTEQIGKVTLSFTDCGLGRMSYRIDGEELDGDFPIERVIPGTEGTCESESDHSLQSVNINAGMDGAWYDENTPGQGFLFDVRSDSEGGNFIFVAWFTFGEAAASGQRWLTAQGPFEGYTAEIGVYETSGGSFNDPQPTDTQPVGTMRVDFEDCNNAQLSYSLNDGTGEGQIELIRLMPDANALCEELAGIN